MTGAHPFNEVFLTDVRIPAENLVGDENRLDAGEGHARQRAGVAVLGWRAVGQGPDGRRPSRRREGQRGRQRSRAAPCEGAAIHIEVTVLDLIRLRTITAHQGEPPGRRRRSARSWPTSTASGSCGPGPRTSDGVRGMLVGAPSARRHVVLRLPLQPGAHRRRRHGRGAAQHRGRACSVSRHDRRRRRRTWKDTQAAEARTGRTPGSFDCGCGR